MCWIRVISEDEAEGPLRDAYDQVQGARGKVSNIMRAHSLAPSAMEAHLELYRTLMFERGDLSRAERELIAVVVSVENGCDYCIRHHSAALEAWWKDPERVARLSSGEAAAAGLSKREEAIAGYARNLTRAPSRRTSSACGMPGSPTRRSYG